jgi:hypothetical protein
MSVAINSIELLMFGLTLILCTLVVSGSVRAGTIKADTSL